MRKFGLIGKTLKHSFSKKYFTEKFEKEGIADTSYELFELEAIDEFPELLATHPELVGLNVTLPYKEPVMQFLTELDQSAKLVGAVNVIKINQGMLTGYNSDYFGFKQSLEQFIDTGVDKALVLGTGGSSKAVIAALKALNIEFKLVSRTGGESRISYEELKTGNYVQQAKLIVNTTPLGMFPNTEQAADLPYAQIGPSHFVFDLVYNPEETLLMKLARTNGAKVKNGLEMLYLQAEKSWEIWNK